jgi:hypothetical protein
MPKDIAGIFLIVMQGSVCINDTVMRKNENVFINPNAIGVQIQTNGLPSQTLILHMPLKDPVYQV